MEDCFFLLCLLWVLFRFTESLRFSWFGRFLIIVCRMVFVLGRNKRNPKCKPSERFTFLVRCVGRCEANTQSNILQFCLPLPFPVASHQFKFCRICPKS